MIAGVNFVEFIAGLGFFLLGMQQIERALNALFGRSLRLTLRNYTRHPLQGIAVGTVATAILQSSSLVTLMLLAFVGAGILSLGNALGVILGANLGTTVTGWLVTTIGFKLDLGAIALPAIGIGALGVVFVPEERRISRYASVILGLGMLLLGLGLMKSSAEEFAGAFDPATIQDLPAIMFVLFGFIFTVIVQSSSAAMMVNLAALSAGLVLLENSAALAIGADVGTTITVALGAVKGTAAKRRVALAHFLFNTCTGIIAFLLLSPLLWLVRHGYGISDPLFSLVAFHSTFNLLGILIFAPFLKLAAIFLERRFVMAEKHVGQFITQVSVQVPEAAIEALDNETRHLFRRSMLLNANGLGITPPQLPDDFGPDISAERRLNPRLRYETIKELEGEMLLFSQSLQEQPLDEAVAARLGQLQAAMRHAVHAAKAIKDIRQNLEAAAESDDQLAGLLDSFQAGMQKIYTGMEELLQTERTSGFLAILTELATANETFYGETTRTIYALKRGRLTDIELSTALNMNREMYSSNKALLSGLKELLLPPEESRELGDIRGLD